MAVNVLSVWNSRIPWPLTMTAVSSFKTSVASYPSTESDEKKTWILNNTQLKSQISHIHLRQTEKTIIAIKMLDTVIVSGWKPPQNFESWIFRPLWDFYPETTENDCHNEQSGHKLSSESCKRVESISARDQYETKYKQQISEADNDKKFFIWLEVKTVIYISKMFRPTIFSLARQEAYQSSTPRQEHKLPSVTDGMWGDKFDWEYKSS